MTDGEKQTVVISIKITTYSLLTYPCLVTADYELFYEYCALEPFSNHFPYFAHCSVL